MLIPTVQALIICGFLLRTLISYPGLEILVYIRIQLLLVLISVSFVVTVIWHVIAITANTDSGLRPFLVVTLDHVIDSLALLLLEEVRLLHLHAPLLLSLLFTDLTRVTVAGLVISTLSWLHQHHHCRRRVWYPKYISISSATP